MEAFMKKSKFASGACGANSRAKRRGLLAGILSIALVFGLAASTSLTLAGCDLDSLIDNTNEDDDDNNGNNNLNLQEACVSGIAAGGFACFTIGGVFYENQPGEKAKLRDCHVFGRTNKTCRPKFDTLERLPELYSNIKEKRKNYKGGTV
jgi:hypothetical protein